MAFDNPLGFFFASRASAPSSYEALAARRRIAEAMMARQYRAPRNVGEGLTSIGEAIGDRGFYDKVLQEDAASKSYEGEKTAALPPPPTAYEPYSPTPRPVVTPPPPPASPQANATPRSVPVTDDAITPNPLPPDQQQDPDSPVIRMPSPQAVQDWRSSVQVPIVPPRPQPGPRSEAAPSPLGAANIPSIAGLPQLSPNVQTASLQSGATASDAPDPAAAAVRDNLAKTQMAQNVFPPVNDASKATIPAGGFPQPQPTPQPPPPAIKPAPQPPPMQAAPVVPPLGPKPAPPQLMPTENDRTKHYEAIAADPRLSPQARQQASTLAATERAQINAFNAQKIQEYNKYLEPWITAEQKLKDPQSVYAAEKARRELEGEGATPLTPEQRQQYGISENQAAYLTRRGEIKFGPAGTKVEVNTAEKAEGKGDQRLQEKLSEHFIKIFDEGDKASDDIKQIAEMRALAARVGTGAGAVVKQYLGKAGIKTEGLDDIQALQAGVSRLIPTQRVPGSGGTSDFDAENFKNSLFALNKTPGGNTLIFDTMEGLANNKLARADVAGRVISGQISRADGVKETLELQHQAKALSDKVKAFVEATGPKPPAAIIPSDDTMREFLKNNPNHPKADEIRKHLGGQ